VCAQVYRGAVFVPRRHLHLSSGFRGNVPPRPAAALRANSARCQAARYKNTHCLHNNVRTKRGDFIEDVVVRWYYDISYGQGRTGSSNRHWLSRQKRPISSGVNRNSGAPAQISKRSPPFLAKGLWVPPLPSLPFFDFVLRSLLSSLSLPFPR